MATDHLSPHPPAPPDVQKLGLCLCPGPPTDTMTVRYLDDLFEASVRLYGSVYQQLLDDIDIDANVTMTKCLLGPLGHHELLPPSPTSCTPSCALAHAW